MTFKIDSEYSELLKNLVLKQQMELKRDAFVPFYEMLNNTNLLIIGMRQVGKSTIARQLSKQYITDKQLSKDEFAYFVLDSRMEYNDLLNIASQIYESKLKLVVFDEIQEAEKWTQFVQQVVDVNPKVKFIFTGSNSLALMQWRPVGRAHIFKLNPLSFLEYKKFWADTSEDVSLDNYLKSGSFPQSKEFDVSLAQYSSYIKLSLDEAINKDFNKRIDRAKFTQLLENVDAYVGNEIKYKEIFNSANVEHRTGKDYINILLDGQIMKSLEKYNDTNVKTTKRKLYFVDKSIINFIHGFHDLPGNEMGALVENVVFNHLDNLINQDPLDFNLFYYRDAKDNEIDFIIPNKFIIEVKYTSNTRTLEETADKMINNKEFTSYQKIIVSKDTNIKDPRLCIISLEKFLSLTSLENIKEVL